MRSPSDERRLVRASVHSPAYFHLRMVIQADAQFAATHDGPYTNRNGAHDLIIAGRKLFFPEPIERAH